MLVHLPSPYPKEMKAEPSPPIDPILESLLGRITHPDILLSILSHVPSTHLPAVLRVSRQFHSIAGPLLYSDISLPFSSTTLLPHVSPLGSLFDQKSSSDLRATLRDSPSRKRSLLERTRTLRLGYHSHHVLPRPMRDLVLDMGKVEVLHLEGTAVCHHDPCPFLKCLKPRVLVLETMCLEIPTIRGITSLERTNHLVVRLRPTSLGMLPQISSTSSFGNDTRAEKISRPTTPEITTDGVGLGAGQTNTTTSPSTTSLRMVQANGGRITILLTPNTYLDGTGSTITLPWRPSRSNRCGEAYSTPKPSFCDFTIHIARAIVCWGSATIVGAEMVDEGWLERCVGVGKFEEVDVDEKDGVVRKRKRSVEEVVRMEVEDALCRLNGQQDGWMQEGAVLDDEEGDLSGGRCNVRFETLVQWRMGADGYLDINPELGMGFKGKGSSSTSVSASAKSPIPSPAMTVAVHSVSQRPRFVQALTELER